MDYQVDRINRDPKHQNEEAVKIEFVDLISEPEGIHSFDMCWEASFVTFTCTKIFCYRALTTMCGIPTALFWGIFFAIFSCIHIWLVVPLVRCILIYLQCQGRTFIILIRYFYMPIFEAMSKLFSNIRVTVQNPAQVTDQGP